MCKYLVHFLLGTNIHPENMTLYLNESVKEKIETTVALGEKNLFEMNEKIEEIIQEIISSELQNTRGGGHTRARGPSRK
jgi:hypothetical protein